MDPLHFCIAMGPLAAYLLLLGIVNLVPRPVVITGTRDKALLGIAVSGFAIVGPMELFFPEKWALNWGVLAWLILLAFYTLCLTLIILMMRPRLLVYNVTVDQLKPVLASVVAELDKDHRWAGESVIIPRLGVQLHLESFVTLRNAQVVASGPRQSYIGWRMLEKALREALRGTRSAPNPYGFFLISVSVIIAGLMTVWLVSDHQGVAQALADMLRL